MSDNPRDALAALRLIAAQAEKLAQDVERGRLWPGEFSAGIATIAKALEDAGRAR